MCMSGGAGTITYMKPKVLGFGFQFDITEGCLGSLAGQTFIQ